MPILPSISSLTSDHGGIKTDGDIVSYSSQEWTASDINNISANAAAASQVVPRAIVSFVPSTRAILTFRSVFGNTVALRPVITKPSTGTYLITFPSQIVDLLGVNQYLNFEEAEARSGGATYPTTGATILCATTSNTITVRTYSSAGAAQDNNATRILVKVY